MDQRRFKKRTKALGLPAKWGNRTDHITGRFFDRFRRGHLNISRADSFLEIAGDCILVAAKHDEHPLTSIGLKDQRFDRLPSGNPKPLATFAAPFSDLGEKLLASYGMPAVQKKMRWQFHRFSPRLLLW